MINIKVSRLGGLLEAKRVHDLCLARGVPVWCGGMHEFGIGRAANVAIASLPGFTLPGDVSGSDKYYAEDIVEPPILAHDGAIAVFDGPGLGVEPVEDRIEPRTLARALDHSRRQGDVSYGSWDSPAMLQRAATRSLESSRGARPARVAQPRQAGARRCWGRCWRTGFATWRARSRSSPTRTAATTLLGRFPGPADLRPALVLGHFDTVWPRGTLERMPFRVDEADGPSAPASST